MNAVIVSLDHEPTPDIRIHCDDRSRLPDLARAAAKVQSALAEPATAIDPAKSNDVFEDIG